MQQYPRATIVLRSADRTSLVAPTRKASQPVENGLNFLVSGVPQQAQFLVSGQPEDVMVLNQGN